ncbi:hypothetical protein N9K49_07090 [Flavobacteriaceae bacterium]|nr:hypothetical protein [Flavobacteriaceae bacterium]
MTTITKKEGKALSRSVFGTFEDLIEEYYASKGVVLLHQIELKDLPAASQKLIEESKKKGKKDLHDFQG